MPARADDLAQRIARGERPAIVLVHGELVLAEPAAERLAAALAAAVGCAVELHRRPDSFAGLLQDLRTFSLFSAAKVLLAVDTSVLADRAQAADLIDEAAVVLPVEADGDLNPRERRAASLLLQAFRLFEVDAQAGEPEAALGALPDWALEGGSASRRARGGRGRGRRQVEELRSGLALLLSAARREGVETTFQGDLSELADLLQGGVPPGHALVMAEARVASDHPIVRQLESRGAVVELGEVSSAKGVWTGLEPLAAELERETGASIQTDALEELGRRTLRGASDRRAGGGGVDPDSSARFAAEYRKLAGLASAGRIDRKLVAQVVEDRGEEDVWQLLDAIAAGRGGEALARLRRLMASADDPLAARLSFFSLLAGFCRQLTAIRGLLRLQGVPPGEANYNRFKAQLAPRLQGEIAGSKNPIAGLHPFRLHRAYLAASRLPERFLAALPDEVLTTELQLKGGSGEPDAALARFVARLSTAADAARS
jgi:DNA polymerase-3 subunit delta